MAKISYGLSNVHYAVVTETTDASTGKTTTSYGDVKAWNGAVNLSFSAEGSADPFYADNMKYFIVGTNNGYSGSFESARVPDDVLESVFGQTKDETTGLLVEKNSDEVKYIALMFESDTDTDHDRYVFYKCYLSRPAIEAQTNEDGKTVKTMTCDINISPRPDDGSIKARAVKGDASYEDFYKSVPVVA